MVRQQGDQLKVSVALCTHNGAAFVAEQVRSILFQSRTPAEIVLSDDASTDNTVEIVQHEVETFNGERSRDVALTVLQNTPALGVTKNFEQAIRHCTGDLVALCDQDDVWHADKLERMAREFDRNPGLTLLHADLQLVDAQGASLGTTLFTAYRVSARERAAIHSGRAIEVYVRRNLVTGASTMFRKELFDVATPFPTAWVHDEWLGIVAATTGRVDCLEDPLVDYRQHGGNQIGAAKMNLRHYVGRMIFPRAERNARLLARARELAEHRAVGMNAVMGIVAQEKLAHEVARSNYPASRWRRISPVLRELRTGRYRRYGLGVQDIARDLIQPA